jgi:hypothetical protein
MRTPFIWLGHDREVKVVAASKAVITTTAKTWIIRARAIRSLIASPKRSKEKAGFHAKTPSRKEERKEEKEEG